MKTQVQAADITTLEVDAIVNAANSSLLGGGGVDGAIHRAAGPELLDYCKKVGPSQTGQVTYTPGFNLPAKAVLHAVGPVWQGGGHGEAKMLRACYDKALHLCDVHELRSVAFPAISTGIYGYPLQQATEVAVATVRSWRCQGPDEVIFCCFTPEDAEVYRSILNA